MKLNTKQLERRCNQTFDDYKSEGNVYNGPRGQHIFQDNGAKILAIAHLDTVNKPGKLSVKKISGETTIFCPTLDDRLGAYLLLDVLPKFGCRYDVLLTDNEECGFSTGADFWGSRYRWMFQFDRRGTDVVMYQYENKEARKAVHQAGLRMGFGSYSDIADMGQLGVCGFNFGTGYYDEHWNAFAVVSDVCFSVRGFLNFYWENHKRKFQFDETTMRGRRRKVKSLSYWQKKSAWGKASYQDEKDWDDFAYDPYLDARLGF